MGFINKDQLAGIMSAVKEYVSSVTNKIQSHLHQYVAEQNYITTTYSDLKKKRDNKELIPGAQYRIIDYQTTTVQPYTESQGIRFDVIVTAIDEKTLSEDAKTINHDYGEEGGFTPFDTSLWEIKYCLDNNVDRFAWADNIEYDQYTFNFKGDSFPECNIDIKYTDLLACPVSQINDIDCYLLPMSSSGFQFYVAVNDIVSVSELTEETEIRGFACRGEIIEFTFEYKDNFNTSKVCNGKGVIYYMKDENGCEAPYDFKNILFDGQETFGNHRGSIASTYDEYGTQILNNIVFNYSEESAIITAESNCKNLRLLNASGNITIHAGVQGTLENPILFQAFSENTHVYTNEGEIAETSPNIIIRRLNDLQNTKIDRENDDYYPKMAVGLADNLAGVDVVDSEINFRRSGGGAITDGVARIESIKGNSVVWNQKVSNASNLLGSNYRNGNNNATFTVEDGAYKLTSVVDGIMYAFYRDTNFINALIKGHKYMRAVSLKKKSSAVAYSTIQGVTGTRASILSGDDKWVAFSEIFTITNISSALPYYQFAIEGTAAGDYLSIKDVQLVDLTKMFGSGNEPTTIEEFNARKPFGIDEYAYNEGEVIHMDVQSIESVGVNQWDEEWELGSISAVTGENSNSAAQIRSKNFNEIMGGTKYALYCSSVTNSTSRIILYDKDYKLVDYWGFTPNIARIIDVPSNVCFFKVSMDATYGTTYKGDICVNLSDTSINGKYYPYIKRVEDLSIIRKYFPQGMKSARSAHDEIRYNKQSGKKEYSKGRLKSVDLGTLNWRYDNERRFIADFSGMSAANFLPNITNSYGYYASAKPLNPEFAHLALCYYNSRIFLYNEKYTDAASFKAAMQGVILYYEAAEWEWVELDEADQFKDLDYAVWNAGTERAIAEGKSAPLAADITYGFNAIGKIKELESLVAALRAKVGI